RSIGGDRKPDAGFVGERLHGLRCRRRWALHGEQQRECEGRDGPRGRHFHPAKRRVGSADTVAHAREALNRSEGSFRASSYATLLWQSGTPRLWCSASRDDAMDQSEIDAVRALLSAKPRPVGWAERRARIDEVGACWPVADDVELASVDLDGVPGEWSIVPGSDASRVLLFFHGGGYCSGSIRSHRRLVTEAGRAAGVRTLAVAYRL